MPEARQHQHPVRIREPARGRASIYELLRVNPVELHVHTVGAGGMPESLDHREVSVLKFYVLTDDRHPHGTPGLVHPGDHLLPLFELRRRRREAQLL